MGMGVCINQEIIQTLAQSASIATLRLVGFAECAEYVRAYEQK